MSRVFTRSLWLWLGLGGLTALGAWLYLHRSSGPGQEPTHPSVSEATPYEAAESTAGTMQATRTPEEGSTSSADEQPGVEVLVLSTDGEPVVEGQLEIPAADGEGEVRSTTVGPDGTVRLPPVATWEPLRWTFATSKGDLAVVSVGVCRDVESKPMRAVVVSPTVEPAFRVLDQERQPIDGQVAIGFRAESLRPLQDAGYEETTEAFRQVSVRCDGNGVAQIGAIPDHPEVVVVATAKGYRAHQAKLPAMQARDNLFLLHPRTNQQLLSGVVLDTSRVAVPEATVRFGQDRTRTDWEGRFALPVTAALLGATLVAYKDGVGIGSLDSGAPDWLDAAQGGTDLVVMLGPADLSLSGRALDERGKPIVGARIALLDGVRWSPVDIRSGESVSVGDDSSAWVVSDASGAFTIENLLAREYRLLLVDPETFLCKVFGPYPAGQAGLELRVEPADFLSGPEGVVQSIAGNPVGGAVVTVRPMPAYERYFLGLESPHKFETDQEGGFRFDYVPWAGLAVSCQGARENLPLANVLAGSAPVLIVEQTCEFLLAGPSVASADSFEVLDSDGERKLIMGRTPRGILSGGKRFYLTADADTLPVCEVGEDAQTVVLYWQNQELSRHPITLVPGQLNRINL